MTVQEKITSDGDHLQFSIDSSFQNVADLAERVSHVCAQRSGDDSDLADMLRLCLAEALNNIVEHAYNGAEGRPIYADVRLAEDHCEVMLIDEGVPMPGGQLPDGTMEFDSEDLSDLPEGGFGWMLIRSEMDDISYERRDGCNVLKMVKSFTA